MLYSKQKRKKTLISLFVQQGFRNLFFMLHISSLSADLKLRTRWQHAAATQIPACIWTHYNSEPIWAALQERTRRKREKEGGQKNNVTAYQLENSSYSDYIVCQGWKSITKKALFVNPAVFMLIFPYISISVCLSLLLLFCKFQPTKHALHRQRDTLDKLFIVSYSHVFFFLGGKPLGCGHKLSICIGSTVRSVLAGCLWSGIAVVEW